MPTKQSLDMSQASLSTALTTANLEIETASHSRISQIVRELVEQSDAQKKQFWVPRWLQCLYFVLGHQHIFWSSNRMRWFPMLITQDKRITVNMVKSRWLNDAARLGKSDPGFQVIASVPTADSREEGRVGYRVLKDLHRRIDMTRKRGLADLQRAMFGTVFFKTYWDDMLLPHEPMPLPALQMDGSPVLDAQGQPEIVVDGKGRPKMQPQQPDGDVAVDMLSVFDVHAPVSAITPFPRDWPWIAEKVAMSVGEIEERYGVRPEADAKAVDITCHLSLDLGKFFSRGDQVYGESRAADSAWVIEYHEAPSTVPGFERGRRIVVAGEELVANEPGVLSDGRLPYHAMPVIPIPLSPWGDCFVPETLEPQMAYNKARSDVSRARSRLAHPHCISPTGAISGDKATDGGRWIEYNFAKGKPEVLDLPGISSGVVSELRASREDVDVAASQFAFSRGEPLGASPQPVSSIELMQHADTTDLLYALRFGAEAMADIGTDLLDLARENYTTERVGMVIGESEDPDIFQYSRTDIAPGLQVIVQEGSEIPVVKEGIRAQMSEIIKSGVLAPVMQDPTFIEHMMDLYEMPAPEQMGSLGGLDMRVQERETREILAGQGGAGQGPGQEPYPVNETDNDDMHIMSIDRRTKYGDWKKIPPDRQMALLAHRQMHIVRAQQRKIQQLQEQMAIQQMMQQAVGPPGPGGPGGPPEGGPPPEGPPEGGENA